MTISLPWQLDLDASQGAGQEARLTRTNMLRRIPTMPSFVLAVLSASAHAHAAWYGGPDIGSIDESVAPQLAMARWAYRFCVEYSTDHQTWTPDSDDCERGLWELDHSTRPPVDEFMPTPHWTGGMDHELLPPARR
jgi:hypothetical protein